jgi:hypothetical protein
MAIAKVIRQEMPSVLLLDELDDSIINTVGTVGEIPLKTLAHSLPEHQYQKIARRVRSLSDWGLIQTGNRRGQVVCFPIRS